MKKATLKFTLTVEVEIQGIQLSAIEIQEDAIDAIQSTFPGVLMDVDGTVVFTDSIEVEAAS